MGKTIEIKLCRPQCLRRQCSFRKSSKKYTGSIKTMYSYRYRHTKRQSDEFDRNGIILDFILLETARRLRAGYIA